jgi:cell division protein FtsL
MEPLIDAVFTEGFALFAIVMTAMVGAPIVRMWESRAARKRAIEKQQFELEKRKLDIELAQLEAKKPTCLTCGHGSGFHQLATGACNQTVQRPNQWNDEGIATGYENVQCGCLDYTGPNPGITGSILGELGQQ